MKFNKNIKLLLSYIILGVIILVFIKNMNNSNIINHQTNKNMIEGMYTADFEDPKVREGDLLGVGMIPEFSQEWEVNNGSIPIVEDSPTDGKEEDNEEDKDNDTNPGAPFAEMKGKGYMVHDTIQWQNGYGNTCDLYVTHGWCKDGKITDENGWPGGKNFNYPEKNCVQCGKRWGSNS
jgi:hypothetical protein